MNKYLIFRTDRIGDLLITCPLIVTIKKHLTNSRITLITSVKNYEYAKSFGIFDKIWVQPAAGDAGGALGAALGYWFHELDNKRISKDKDFMQGAYLGHKFSSSTLLWEFAVILKYYSAVPKLLNL